MKTLISRVNYITFCIAIIFLTTSNVSAIQKFGTNVRVLDKTSLQISVWGNGYAMKASLEKLIFEQAALNSKKYGFNYFSLENSYYSTEKSSANFVSKNANSEILTMKYSTNKNGKVIENNGYQPPALVSINYDRYLLSTIVIFSTSNVSDTNLDVYNADSILSSNIQYQHYFKKSNNAVASTALTISAPTSMLANDDQANTVAPVNDNTILTSNISKAFASEQWDNVVRLTSELITLEPENHIAYSTRAGALAEIYLLQDALRDANYAIDLKADYKNSYHNRAYIFGLLGQKQDAILNYDTACNLGVTESCQELEKLSSSVKSVAITKALSVDTLLVLTDRAYEQKKWLDAIKYSTKVITLDPSHFIALTNRSGALEKINLPHYALRDVNLAIALQANYQKSYHHRATIYAKLNQADNSMANYKIACDMGSKISCSELSNMNVAALSPAANNSSESAAPHSDSPEVNSLLAATDKAFSVKNWTEVVLLSSNVVDQDPGNFVAYSNRAGALAELGLLEDALRDANKAVFLQPSYVNSYHNLGYIYSLMDDHASASINYKSACDRGVAVSCQEFQAISKLETIAANKKSVSLDSLLANISLQAEKKQWINVIKTSTDILKQDPMSPAAYSTRARALANVQLLSYALRDANHAIALQPDFNDSYTNRAYVYALLEDTDRAKSDYKKACDLGAKDGCAKFDVLNGNTSTMTANASTNGPKGNAVEIASITPVQDLLKQSQSAFSAEQWKKVIELSEKILIQDPVNFLAFSNRSGAYAETGKYTLALSDVNQALRLNSEFKNAYHNRAYIHSLMKNTADATADYQKACKLGINASCDEFSKLTSLAENDVSRNETLTNIIKMPTVDDLLAATNTAFADKKWDTVIELSTKIINQNRTNFLAFSNRSGAFAEKGKLKQALKDVNRSIALNKDYRNSYHNRAYIYSLLENNLAATTDYKKACDLGISQSCDELTKLQSKLAAVEKQEDKTIIQIPTVDGLLAATTTAFGEKNWDKVIELSTKIINQNRSNFLAYSNRSGAFAEKGKLKQALKDVNKSIALNKDFKNSYHNRAYIHSLMNNDQFAKTDYEKACEMGVSISCDEATRLNATEKKLADITQSKQTKDVNPSIVILLAATNNAFNKKQWSEVIKLSTEIIKRDPRNYLAYSNRSGALAEQGYLNDALTDANESIALNSDFSNAYHNRAYIFTLLNDSKSAALDYKNACDRGVNASCEEYGKITAVANAKLP